MNVNLEMKEKDSWSWRVVLDKEAANRLRQLDRGLLSRCGKWTGIDNARSIQQQVKAKLGLG